MIQKRNSSVQCALAAECGSSFHYVQKARSDILPAHQISFAVLESRLQIFLSCKYIQTTHRQYTARDRYTSFQNINIRQIIIIGSQSTNYQYCQFPEISFSLSGQPRQKASRVSSGSGIQAINDTEEKQQCPVRVGGRVRFVVSLRPEGQERYTTCTPNIVCCFGVAALDISKLQIYLNHTQIVYGSGPIYQFQNTNIRQIIIIGSQSTNYQYCSFPEISFSLSGQPRQKASRVSSGSGIQAINDTEEKQQCPVRVGGRVRFVVSLRPEGQERYTTCTPNIVCCFGVAALDISKLQIYLNHTQIVYGSGPIYQFQNTNIRQIIIIGSQSTNYQYCQFPEISFSLSGQPRQKASRVSSASGCRRQMIQKRNSSVQCALVAECGSSFHYVQKARSDILPAHQISFAVLESRLQIFLSCKYIQTTHRQYTARDPYTSFQNINIRQIIIIGSQSTNYQYCSFPEISFSLSGQPRQKVF
ncbi:Hypothetical_protein [Hexamita inflata]|uniref:Hypothetical_protein n=1 Tax=Hexamita inflata TaxID=28002 RepID=A0AA86P8X0_9EUKA|nr:Hypothetical protein HINF_LOCUS20783 [Hexamita inflata]